MKKVRMVPFVDAAKEIMNDFLQSMPEITLDQDTGENIARAYHGDAHSYQSARKTSSLLGQGYKHIVRQGDWFSVATLVTQCIVAALQSARAS